MIGKPKAFGFDVSSCFLTEKMRNMAIEMAIDIKSYGSFIFCTFRKCYVFVAIILRFISS